MNKLVFFKANFGSNGTGILMRGAIGMSLPDSTNNRMKVLAWTVVSSIETGEIRYLLEELR